MSLYVILYIIIKGFNWKHYKHEQVKNSTTAEYLLADKNKFNDIAERLMLVNETMLTSLIEGIKSGSIKSETDEKKNASNSYQTWMLSIIKFKNQ